MGRTEEELREWEEWSNSDYGAEEEKKDFKQKLKEILQTDTSKEIEIFHRKRFLEEIDISNEIKKQILKILE